jgi:hypothetical protein
MPLIPSNPRFRRWRIAASWALAVPIFACAIFEIHRKTDHLRPDEQLSAPDWRQRDDVVAAVKARPYESLRNDLRGVESVGFVPAKPAFEGERMIAQSMLAPTLVVSSADAPLVIAGFETAEELEDFLLSHRFTIRRRVGDGQALLQRDGR